MKTFVLVFGLETLFVNLLRYDFTICVVKLFLLGFFKKKIIFIYALVLNSNNFLLCWFSFLHWLMCFFFLVRKDWLLVVDGILIVSVSWWLLVLVGVFRHLRELFAIDPADYMLAICGSDTLREMSSPGKSGSIFYLTQDDRFIIKTVKKSEVKVSWLECIH